MIQKSENQFRDSRLRPLLDLLPRTGYFIKEAKSIVGIPDIIGDSNSKAWMLEVKKSNNAKRSAMQEYRINKALSRGSFASFVYPENYYFVLCSLIEHCFEAYEAQSLTVLLLESLPVAERKRLIPLLKQQTPAENISLF